MGFNIKETISSRLRTTDVETISINSEEKVNKYDDLVEYNERYPEPTEEDYATLPRVLGHAPYATYIICLVEFAERASYYGVKDRLNNFIQLPLPTGGNGAGAPPSGDQQNAGALGMGLQTASAITLLLTFLAYLTPLFGGYISDKRLGRMKTIWYGVWIGVISHIILIIAAIPSVIREGAALAPTIIAILSLAVCTGFIKPNLLPLLYDQYPHKRDIVETKPNGKKVIVAKESTLERMTLFFYWAVNAGAFLSLATSYSAKKVGFWLAFLIPGIVYMIMIPTLMVLSSHIKKEKPSGTSILEDAFKVLRYTFKGGWFSRVKINEFWEYAKPSNILSRGEFEAIEAVNKKGQKKISWTDQFVQDLKITLDACKIFLFFIIYNINDVGIGAVQTSQANSMTTNGVPNDLINNFNPLTIIVFIPFLDYVLYPLLRKYKIEFRPVYRIFTGFIIASFASVAGAIIQWKVYETSPCGYHATECKIGTGVSPISVWVETVVYVLQASSECFAMTAAYEIAYTRAPEHMKGLVMALFLFTSSISAAISEACTSALVDPYLIWPFVAIAAAGFISAFVFLWLYRDLHKVMDKERLEKEAKLKEEFLALHDANAKYTVTNTEIDAVVAEELSIEDDRKHKQGEEDAVFVNSLAR